MQMPGVWRRSWSASAAWCVALTAGLALLCSGCDAGKNDAAARAQTEQELAGLRETNQELQRLRTENQDLPKLRRDNEELKRLREQVKDLAQLREENNRLRGEIQALKAPKPKP